MSNAPEKLNGVQLKVMNSMADVGEFFTWLGQRRPVLGFDLETTGLDWVNGKIRTFQFGDAKTGWVARADLWAGVMDEVLREYTRPMTGHNVILFDTMWTRQAGLTLARPHLLDDTLAMHHVYRAEDRHALKPLADAWVDPRASVLQAALEHGMHTQGWTWETVPWDFEPYRMYSALDGPLAAIIWEHLQNDPTWSREVYEVERQVMLAAADMQFRGVHIDTAYARQLYSDLGETAEALKARCTEEFGVTPSKNAEIAAAMERDGVVLTERTATGAWKLDAEVLKGLADVHPLAALVQEYKRAVKFRKAYVEKALEMDDGQSLVHPSISTLGAVTGRMSVSGWPAQQIPAGNKSIRRMITSRYPGGRLISVDQSNIEMRTMAGLSGERALVDAFMHGADVHQFMADIVFPGDPKGRKKIKTVSFAKIYGAGPRKMAVTLGASVDTARAVLADYDNRFPDIEGFVQGVQEIARERYLTEGHAYINLPNGRRLGLANFDARNGAFYKLVNFACQGYAAALMKQDMVDLAAAGLLKYAVMPIHDEILFDLPPEVDPADFADAVQEIMNHEAGDPLIVPIATDAEIYPESWGDCVEGKLSKEEWRAQASSC